MTDGKIAFIQQLFQEYDIESTSDIQDALKDLLGGTIKEMMEMAFGLREIPKLRQWERTQWVQNQNIK